MKPFLIILVLTGLLCTYFIGYTVGEQKGIEQGMNDTVSKSVFDAVTGIMREDKLEWINSYLDYQERVTQERKQWQEAVDTRDAIIRYYKELPPVEFEKIVEVEVIKEVKTPYEPVSFNSTQEVRDWLDKWEVWSAGSAGNNICEAYAFAMIIDLVNDGYLIGGQIDTRQQHMLAPPIPIYSENRWVFIDPYTKTLKTTFNGTEWKIN